MLDEDHKAFLISFSYSFIQHDGDSFVLLISHGFTSHAFAHQELEVEFASFRPVN